MPRPRAKRESAINTRHADVRKQAFLANLRLLGNVSAAAALVEGLNRTTVYKHWLAEDPEFKEAFGEAIEESVDRLEQEARRRAHDGVREPVYQGGELVGHKQVYSDTLMVVLLKAHRPEKFSERHRVEGGDKPLSFTLNFGESDVVEPTPEAGG
jgi:hypothetical protein